MAIRFLTTCFLVCLVLIPADSASAQQQLLANGPNQWVHDYGQARRLSRKLGLPVIVHFHASWCGPCQQMQRETLGSKTLKPHLGTSFIGVKIDSDREPGLVDAFRVRSLPTDVVIAPSGKIVDRVSGYQSRLQYMGLVKKWSQNLRAERQQAIATLERRNVNPAAQNPMIRPMPMPTPMPLRNPGSVATNQQQPARQQPATVSPSRQTILGLDGYSPVQIKNSRRWIRGDSRFAATYKGIVYYLTSEAELQVFLQTPHHFAPRMLGCDPVVLWQTDRVVAGSVEFGAFYQNELYLFQSADSRTEFKKDPARFTRIRHALRATDIQRPTRIARGQ